MSMGRDELHELVDERPGAEVPGVIAEVRGRLAPTRAGTWPPVFFGSIDRPRSGANVSERVDELLAEGFGRD